MSSVLKKFFIWDSSFSDDKWGILMALLISISILYNKLIPITQNQQEQTMDNTSVHWIELKNFGKECKWKSWKPLKPTIRNGIYIFS